MNLLEKHAYSFIDKSSINDISKYYCFQDVNCDDIDTIERIANEINIPKGMLSWYSNWFNIDGSYYYFKDSYILTELFLSLVMQEYGVNSVEYKLTKFNDKYGIISENFRKKGYEYLTFYKILDDLKLDRMTNINTFGDRLLFEYDTDLNIKRKFYDIACIEYLFGQYDREEYNLLFEKKDRNVDLCPLFDFELSFKESFRDKYESCFQELEFPSEYTKELYKNDGIFSSSLEDKMDIDVEQILKKLCDIYPIKCDKAIIEFIRTYYDEQRKNVELILKRN